MGASASLGGTVDEAGLYGGRGAEAHSYGKSSKRVHLAQNPQEVSFIAKLYLEIDWTLELTSDLPI